MQTSFSPTSLESTSNSRAIPFAESLTDYSEFLMKIGIQYKPYEYYWQVGDISMVQGWILHLSVVISQLKELLSILIPVLISQEITFKIVKDRSTALFLLEGNFGYKNVGKIVSIYPKDGKQAAELAKLLVEMTGTFKGPHIPTDRHLGGIVYARYGSFSPIFIRSANGEMIKYIYNTIGELIPDPYTIPFLLPIGINWPFQVLTSPVIPKTPKLLNYTYYPISILKNDVKGKVVKALYFKRFWQIQACVIKEGYEYVFSDESGRDIKHRLQWQLFLHKELAKTIRLPKLIEYFEQSGNAYLVMEYIKGISINDFIPNIYKERNWLDLPLSHQLKLLDNLSTIVSIIELLHENGYIHRDITPANFLIARKDIIYLIDLELAWDTRSGNPAPPFKLGTPGFMSPEQFAGKTPTANQDIYALGALMISFFTNLTPDKLPLQSPHLLTKAVTFFTGNQELATIIESCLQSDPSERPNVAVIKGFVDQYRKRLKEGNTALQNSTFSKINDIQHVREVIQMGINGLANSKLLSSRDRWLSQKKDNEIGNDQLENIIYEGWHTGMAGPLWLVARARSVGFDINSCQLAYDNSWDYLHKHFFKDPADSDPGLFSGGAGIAMALSEGIASGMLVDDAKSMCLLKDCFIKSSSGISISEGIAGQGISLLKATKWLDSVFTENLLKAYVHLLLNLQLPNGSWDIDSDQRDKTASCLSLNNGIPGIIWFLLAYLEKYPMDSKAKNAALKALRWLVKKARITASNNWRVGTNKTTIVLLFIKAFESLKEPFYREIVDANLKLLTPRPVIADFTFASGLANLGELYLDAHRVFNDLHYRQTTDWITNLYCCCLQNWNSKEGYWLVNNNSSVVTADLFRGCAGVLHYLIRYLYPDKLSHPLWPKT